MIRTIPLIIFMAGSIVLPRVAIAQDDSALVNLLTQEKISECPTYIANAKLLIPGYYENFHIDSIYVVLGFLERNCEGNLSEFETLRNLLSIEQSTFQDQFCDREVQSEILSGYRSGNHIIFPIPHMISMVSFELAGDSYNLFIENLIQKMLAETDSLSIENLYCHFLLRDYDYIIELLHKGEFPETCLSGAYAIELNRIRTDLRDELKFHYSYNLGLWSPRGASSTLGNKLAFGGQLGIHKDRYIGQISLFLRALKSANVYEVRHDGVLTPTDHFFGAYFGAEAGIEAIRIRRFELDLHGGLGYDGWESIKEGSDPNGISSLNINIGGTMRMFYNKERTRYLGIQGRYNIVKYGTGGGTDLSGNTVSVHLVLGYLANSDVIDRAKRLLYYD